MSPLSQSTSGTRGTPERAAILIAAIFQVVATMLPSLGIGEPIGDQSDDVRTAITPAGWAFSIWGLLFAGSIAYALYQTLPAQRDSALIARIGWASAGAFLGNGLWALYTQSIDLNFVSALIILFTLACLIVCLRAFTRHDGFTKGELFLVVLPLSMLAAWLTAASIVNIAASLEYHGLDLGEATGLVGAAVILIGGIIAAAAVWNERGNPFYAIVFLWALAGIFAASRGGQQEVSVAAILAALIVAAATLLRLSRPGGASHWFRSSPSAAPRQH